MSESFIITYKPGESFLLFNGEKLKEISINLKNSNCLNFKVLDGFIEFVIDFFIVENIFLEVTSENLFISNKPSENWEINLDCLSTYGYYPLSMSAYKNINVLVSFLRYRYDGELIFKSAIPMPLRKTKTNRQNILEAFEFEISRFKSTHANRNTILPLSGGIDSRLILSHFMEEEKLNVYTFGEEKSGDILVVKQICRKYPHLKTKFFKLEDLNHSKIKENLKNINYMLPLERILYPSPDQLYNFDDAIILSGLYGDVIFSDKNKLEKFETYIQKVLPYEKITHIDQLIIKAYSEYPLPEKINLLLLRAQKLTKQSLNMTAFDVFIPFLKNEVIRAVIGNSQRNLYPYIVKHSMQKSLRTILHQTSLSTYTYPKIIRVLQKIYHRLIRSNYCKPYFSTSSINRLNNYIVEYYGKDYRER